MLRHASFLTVSQNLHIVGLCRIMVFAKSLRYNEDTVGNGDVCVLCYENTVHILFGKGLMYTVVRSDSIHTET